MGAIAECQCLRKKTASTISLTWEVLRPKSLFLCTNDAAARSQKLGSLLANSWLEVCPMLDQAEQLEQAPESTQQPVSAVLEVRSLRSARRQAVDRFEVEYVQQILRKSNGNVTKAAAIAEVSRQVIHKLIAKHRL
jgi:DNA-binding NtrC family response regulator